MTATIVERTSIPAARVCLTAADRAWILERIDEVLASGRLTLGPWGERFEAGVAALCGRRHAVAVSSGTAALEILMRTLGARDRDVLVPTNTFVATAAAVVHAGGRPVLCDLEPRWLGIDPAEAERRLTPRTAGIVCVHVGGIVSPSLPALRDLAARKGLWLVEDASHAHGCSLGDVPAGALGDAAAFSFYPTKVVTSCEGGMIVTDDERVADEARILRDQGKASFVRNEHVRLGSNWRLSELHAIVGARQLERLPELARARRETVERYASLLADAPAEVLAPPAGATGNGYKAIVVPKRSVDRERLRARLRSRGVALAGEVYELPLHRQPALAPFSAGSYPAADAFCASHVCLPVHPELTEGEVEHVARSLSAELGSR